MNFFSLDFLRILSYTTLRWYRDQYETMLNDPPTNTPAIRFTYAILNAEIARRLVKYSNGKEE